MFRCTVRFKIGCFVLYLYTGAILILLETWSVYGGWLNTRTYCLNFAGVPLSAIRKIMLVGSRPHRESAGLWVTGT